MLDILFGSGIDSMGCMLDAALDLGIIERRGSWYAYQGKQLAQGRVNTIEYLKGDLGLDVQSQVREALANFGKPQAEEADVEEEALVDEPVNEESVME